MHQCPPRPGQSRQSFQIYIHKKTFLFKKPYLIKALCNERKKKQQQKVQSKSRERILVLYGKMEKDQELKRHVIRKSHNYPPPVLANPGSFMEV